MENLKKVFSNKWFILVISLLCSAYTMILCYFAYAVFFYDIVYVDKTKFALIYAAISLLTGLLFFYTRRSFVTCIISLANMLVFFPTLLLDWGNWPLLVPAAIVTLFGFFACKMNDTMKTVFGTIYLLLYILGGIAFFLVMNVFRVTTVDTLLTPEGGIVSPSENFRCYVMDVQNKSSGKVAVYVEPNKLDKDLDFIVLRTSIKKLVKQAGKENRDDALRYDVHWDKDKLYINGEEYFCEADFLTESASGDVSYNLVDDVWKHTYFEFDYPIFDLIDRITTIVSEKLLTRNEDNSDMDDTEETTTISESANRIVLKTVPMV
ncbi:MAG: hypothetical protein K2H23_00375 [Oscillospiraceae bacterium]|nr:hypothetical protein [Oscillospiraceae bacterium]